MAAKKSKPRKKTGCPVSREQFRKHAKVLDVKIGNTDCSGEPREFYSGALGWYLGDKVSVTVDGVKCKTQVTCSIVLVGSHELEGGPPQDE